MFFKDFLEKKKDTFIVIFFGILRKETELSLKQLNETTFYLKLKASGSLLDALDYF